MRRRPMAMHPRTVDDRRGRPRPIPLALAVGLALAFGGCTGTSGPSLPVDASGGVLPPATGQPSGGEIGDGTRGSGPVAPSERPTASVPGGLATLPPSGAPVMGEVPERVLAAILEDAARRTGADPATAKILRAEAVTWSDGSLGCPEPGMFYTQALVDGYWVVVELGGTTLDYRVGAHGAFRLCEEPSPGAP
jgi:hypothetical protein